MINYNIIKQLALDQGLTIADLCALDPKNDPFYTGRPSEIAAAEWFARLWQQFGFQRDIHLRRIHYRIVSQDPPIQRPDGQTYENTERDWAYLNNAGKWSRYLGLVSPRAFVDRRNPEAIIHARWPQPDDWDYQDPTPRYEIINDWDGEAYRLPDLPELPALPDVLPAPSGFIIEGYDGIQQPYLIELWAEKTTMNDVLIPICRRYAVNLITGAGEMSITACVEFLQRVIRAGRPARILYISDFDPAGLGMPISVARKIEYFVNTEPDRYGDLDIRLKPIILNGAQVAHYNLPRIPVKDTDRRKANFESSHGEGQVELDALEALYPGELERIVSAAILDYHDPDLPRRARAARGRLIRALEDERDRLVASYQPEIDQLDATYNELLDEFEATRQEFDDLIADFQPTIQAHVAQLDHIKDEAEKLHYVIAHELAQIELDLADDDYRLPDPDLPAETDDHLYISQRDYIAQLTAYKQYRFNTNTNGATHAP